jgi:hypothetical protein
MVDRAAVGQVSAITSVSCQSVILPIAAPSTASIIQGWNNMPISGLSNARLGFTAAKKELQKQSIY